MLSQEYADDLISLEISLPPDERNIVFARVTLRRSFASIGAQFGLTAEAARKRYQRARARLKTGIEELKVRYATRDEPDVIPPPVRVTTEKEMRQLLAQMKANGATFSEAEEAKLLSGLPRRRE